MNDHRDQLSEAFRAHESQTPDPAEVYARVRELAGKYKRRRWGAQAAGGAVLGAGLIAGGIALPGVLPAAPGSGNGIVAPAAAPASPSAAPSPSTGEDEAKDARNAYFDAGYDYDDAMRLAKLWNMPEDPGLVKTEAGRRILAGEALPIKPKPGNVVDAKETARVEAFFAAGYDYDDAAELAKLWKLAEPYQAKVEGGRRLLDKKKLPIKPDPANVEAAKDAERSNAFFDAGYDYDDAVKLAKLWKMEPYQAKVEGGKRILAGDELPIRP